jgi:hypothetical protein
VVGMAVQSTVMMNVAKGDFVPFGPRVAALLERCSRRHPRVLGRSGPILETPILGLLRSKFLSRLRCHALFPEYVAAECRAVAEVRNIGPERLVFAPRAGR